MSTRTLGSFARFLVLLAAPLVGCAHGTLFDGGDGASVAPPDGTTPNLNPSLPFDSASSSDPATDPSPSSGVFTGTYPPGAIATIGAFDEADTTHTPILIYGPRPGKNASPLTTLRVPSAPGSVVSIAFDAHRRLYVLEYSGHVSVFADGASGSVAPEREINPAGIFPASGNTATMNLAIDREGRLYLAVSTFLPEVGLGAILEYDAGVSGAALPSRVLYGAHTGFDTPTELAVDENEDLFVGDYMAGTVSVFPKGASGDATPIRQVEKASIHAMAVSRRGDIFASGEGTPEWSVERYGATGGTSVLAGPNTGLDPDGMAPLSMKVDPWGDLVVVTSTEGLIFAPNASGDVAPIGSFAGSDAVAVAPRSSSGS